MTVQMKLQFPQELNFVTGMDMGVLKDMGPPTVTLYYCLEISAPNKTGRPKNDKRILSALEVTSSRQGRGRGRGGGERGHGQGCEDGRGRGGVGRGRGEGGGDGRGCGMRTWKGSQKSDEDGIQFIQTNPKVIRIGSHRELK